MLDELVSLANRIGDVSLRSKVVKLIKEPAVRIIKEEFRFSLLESPAGVFRHHSYKHGLIQHLISVTKLGITFCDILDEIYGAEVDKDVVIAGCILHDLTKGLMYRGDGDGGYRISKIGERIDHISLIISELNRREFPLEVIHAVAAHHAEFGIIHPNTIEAIIVHIADISDSRLNGKILEEARRIIYEAVGSRIEKISLIDASKILQISSKKDVKAVRKYVEDRLNLES